MQKPPRGCHGNGRGATSGQQILYEAVSRHTPARSVAPAGADGTGMRTAGVHGLTSSVLTQRSDKSPSGQKGSDDDASVQQRRPGLWTDEEIAELTRLVSSTTDTQGKISWEEIEKAWRDLNLSERTKASLSSKWRDVKSRARTEVVFGGRKRPQQGTAASPTYSVTSDTDVVTELAPVDEGNTVDDNNNNSQLPETAAAGTDNTTLGKDVKNAFSKFLKISKKIGCKPNRRKAPRKVSGKLSDPIINEVDGLIKAELDMENNGRPSWDKLSIIVYAGAMTVSDVANRKFKEKSERTREWFQNSYKEMSSLRVTIGKATSELNRQKAHNLIKPIPQQLINIRMLKRKYNVATFAEITSLVERLKIRLQLLRSRISLRRADEERVRVRHLPPKMIMRGIGKEISNDSPNVHQIRSYWKGIVGKEKIFNSQDKDLIAWKRSLTNLSGSDDLRESLSLQRWEEVVRKAKPWKAHGPDGLQSYWWKAFKSASAALYHLARYHLTSGVP